MLFQIDFAFLGGGSDVFGEGMEYIYIPLVPAGTLQSPYPPAVSCKCIDIRAGLCIYFYNQEPSSLGTLKARRRQQGLPRLRFPCHSSQPGEQLKINTSLPLLSYLSTPTMFQDSIQILPPTHTHTHTHPHPPGFRSFLILKAANPQS